MHQVNGLHTASDYQVRLDRGTTLFGGREGPNADGLVPLLAARKRHGELRLKHWRERIGR